MKNKLNQLISSLVSTIREAWESTLKPKLLTLDAKITIFLPNLKLKKILYILIGSLFGFMFLVIIVGIITSPFRNKNNSQETVLNKPQIKTSSPAPQKELTETLKKILDLEIKIKDMRFPESTLNIPVLESDIKI